MRLLLISLGSIALATSLSMPAVAAPCRDGKGKFIKCIDPKAAPKKCKDAKGRFAKCGAPGAKPV